MPKLQEIFTTVAIVCHRYERLDVLQNVFAIILLWARKGVERLFEETVYKSIKTKKEAEMKFSVWDLKMPGLAQIVEQSSGMGQVCVSIFFLFWSLYKTNKKWGKNISDTLACGSRATSLFFHVLTSSVIYYWTDAGQHGIYFLNIHYTHYLSSYWLRGYS